MSREIKFRAWDKEGAMIYDTDGDARFEVKDGKLNVWYAKTTWREGGGETYEWNSWEELDVIPMQYTGLKDKNGVEIYEGDVLSNGRYEYKVVFENGAFYLYHTKLMDMCEPYRWGPMLRISETNFKIEVVGNIYHNPELINQ